MSNTVHAGFSFVADIDRESIPPIEALLKSMNLDPGGNTQIAFKNCKTVQFASSVIIPEQAYERGELPNKLFFTTSYVGPLEVHLAELVAVGKNGLIALLGFCKNFPQGAKTDNAILLNYLKSNNMSSTFYSGIQYITHEAIGRENALRNNLENFIDKAQQSGAFKGKTPLQIQSVLQDSIRENAEFSWAQEIWKKTWADFWLIYNSIIKAGIYVLLFLVIFFIVPMVSDNPFFDIFPKIGWSFLGLCVLLLLVIAVSFRLNEKKKHFLSPRPPDKSVREIYQSQKHYVINEMTISGSLKAGWVRVVFLKIFLKIVGIVRFKLYIPGVITARWLTVDKGERLVFISNFINISDGYVRDFIDSGPRASKINLSFGQGRGYPVTKWFINKGAHGNPEGFMNVVHQNQQITPFWYWPYPQLTAANINVNRNIYLGLFAKLDDAKAKKWLELF